MADSRDRLARFAGLAKKLSQRPMRAVSEYVAEDRGGAISSLVRETLENRLAESFVVSVGTGSTMEGHRSQLAESLRTHGDKVVMAAGDRALTTLAARTSRAGGTSFYLALVDSLAETGPRLAVQAAMSHFKTFGGARELRAIAAVLPKDNGSEDWNVLGRLLALNQAGQEFAQEESNAQDVIVRAADYFAELGLVDSEAAILLARAHFSLGDFPEAIATLEDHARQDDDAAMAWLDIYRGFERLDRGGFWYRPNQVDGYEPDCDRVLCLISDQEIEIRNRSSGKVTETVGLTLGTWDTLDLPLDAYLMALCNELLETAISARPSGFHVRADPVLAVAANRVSAALGIPCIYERGRPDSNQESDSPYSRLLLELVVLAEAEADAVIEPQELPVGSSFYDKYLE